MINFDKHTIRLGTGDVDINVLESPSGLPVLAFSNCDEDFSMPGFRFWPSQTVMRSSPCQAVCSWALTMRKASTV